MPESNRPDWLWTPSTRVGRKFHYHGGTYYQARAYIERLEAELKAKDEHMAHVDAKCQADLDRYLAEIITLTAEIERLKAVERSRCDCGHPKADHDFSDSEFITPCLPRSRCGCNNYVPLYPTPPEEPRRVWKSRTLTHLSRGGEPPDEILDRDLELRRKAIEVFRNPPEEPDLCDNCPYNNECEILVAGKDPDEEDTCRYELEMSDHPEDLEEACP